MILFEGFERMKHKQSGHVWKYLIDEDEQILCGYCGKMIESPKQAYALVLELVNPVLASNEGILWNSDPYCSEECFNKVINVILNDLRSNLFEITFSKKPVEKDTFKSN